MKSPLSVDKKTIKEYKIEPEFDVSPVRKLGFLQGQLQELEGAFWRARVDVIHSERLIESDVEAIKNKGHNNLSEHKNQVVQFYGGIKMIRQLIEELRAEYPELQVEE